VLSVATVACAALLFAPKAGAKELDVDRPWSLQLGLGPEVGLPSGGVQGKLALDFQYHFRRTDVGPALGLQTHMQFASGLFGMAVGPIFLWDFRVVATKKFKLYVAPLVALGYRFTTIPALDATAHGFFMDFGAQLKVVVNDRVGFFVRPANFSLVAGKGGAAGAYAFVAGVALTF
jgi:hypothetical protein